MAGLKSYPPKAEALREAARRFSARFHDGDYLEQPLSADGLRRLVTDFEIEDYTLRVIAAPKQYGAEDVIPRGWKLLLYRLLARPLYGLLPGYIWVLRKR